MACFFCAGYYAGSKLAIIPRNTSGCGDFVFGIYQELQERLSAGQPVVLISQPACQQRAILPPMKNSVLGSDHEALARQALLLRRLQYVPKEQGGPLLIEPFFPSSRLVVLGGGHVALALVAGAARLGWSVTVVMIDRNLLIRRVSRRRN